MDRESTRLQEQLTNSILSGPHVVILGSGATIAAIPNGDKNGLKSSVMNGFVRNLGLEDLMAGLKLKTTSDNLEDIYSELHDIPKYKGVCNEIETRIFNYYNSLIIPDTPTAYDYLVLSLRKKDWIFSFNWDNLLIQAYARCYKITRDLPELVFLHGNVNVAYCSICGKPQRRDFSKCCQCGGELIPTPLLYPIRNKDYTSSDYIRKAWEVLKLSLDEASVLTVFGYSAPKTDAAAIDLMRTAFAKRTRWYSQFEVIDVAPRNIIYDSWSDFITAVHEHISIHRTIFDGTLMGEFPRRTIEGYVKRNFDGWWGASSIQLRECKDFSELESLIKPLIEREEYDDYTVVS